MRTCKFCGCDISAEHHNRLVCHGEACQAAMQALRKESMRRVSARHRDCQAKKAKVNGRRCRQCHKLLINGNRFFCNDLCSGQYAGGNRVDENWAYA